MAQVLIAEDDPHILRVISLWLSRQGHVVREARNGRIALDMALAKMPDILVTDINMPELDGLELLEHLRDEPRRPRGIVVLTNRWDHREIGEKLAEHGVHVMPKPFSPTHLAELIDHLAHENVEETRA